MSESIENGDSTDRRSLMRAAAVGGGALVAGAVGGVSVAAASGGRGSRRNNVEFDVACLGETWRDAPFNFAEDEGDFRGQPFSVEGWVYPAGHIATPGDGFVPGPDEAIGRWLCMGSTLVHARRIEPHAQSTQQFVFAPMSGEELFAADNLTTSGTEGTFETNQTAIRSISGGTGKYLGATGEARQVVNGFNTSSFSDGTGNAPNFRITFELLLPDV